MAVENQDYIDYQNWVKDQSSSKNNIARNIKIPYLIVGGIIILIVAKLWQTQQENRIWFLFVAIGVFVVLILMGREKKEKKRIPEHIAKYLVQNAINRKTGYMKDFPSGTELKVTGYVKTRWVQSDATAVSTPFRIDVGFKAIYPNGLRKDFIAHLHPYDGDIFSIVGAPTGFDGTESVDVRVVEKQMTVVTEEELRSAQEEMSKG